MSNLIIIPIFTAILIHFVHSVTVESCTYSNSNVYQIVHICIRIFDSANAYVYSFPAAVDKISVLEISNLSNIINAAENMTLSVEMNNITSPNIIIQDVTSNLYINPVNIVIRTTAGKMDVIYYDYQDCTSCSITASKTCGSDGVCYSKGALNSQNSLLIYVSWIGSDVVGQHYISHTLRLKKLNVFSQFDIFNQALTLLPA